MHRERQVRYFPTDSEAGDSAKLGETLLSSAIANNYMERINKGKGDEVAAARLHGL